jgi:hypothetical protein
MTMSHHASGRMFHGHMHGARSAALQLDDPAVALEPPRMIGSASIILSWQDAD